MVLVESEVGTVGLIDTGSTTGRQRKTIEMQKCTTTTRRFRYYNSVFIFIPIMMILMISLATMRPVEATRGPTQGKNGTTCMMIIIITMTMMIMKTNMGSICEQYISDPF